VLLRSAEVKPVMVQLICVVWPVLVLTTPPVQVPGQKVGFYSLMPGTPGCSR
jgi:hypothetical protein